MKNKKHNLEPESKDPIGEKLKGVIAWAKKRHNILEYHMHSNEFEPAFTEEKNNIPYPSREGFSSEDIYGYFLPDSWSHYFKANISNFLEAKKEFGFFSALKFFSLHLPWSDWVWTLHSTKYIANELVDNSYGPKVKKKKVDKEYYYKHYDRLVSEITQEQIIQHLDQNYKKINENIWVNPYDYSVFYYNHFNKPYELRDGWSLRQVGEIMKEWTKAVMNEEMDVCHVRR